MSLYLTDDKSRALQVMAWCRQAITWTHVDPDLCRHMASLGYNAIIYFCNNVPSGVESDRSIDDDKSTQTAKFMWPT